MFRAAEIQESKLDYNRELWEPKLPGAKKGKWVAIYCFRNYDLLHSSKDTGCVAQLTEGKETSILYSSYFFYWN